MITDEMLSAAAGEVGTCILDSLPPVVEHDFSRNFRRKTKRLIFKTDHPTMHILRNCAAVLLVLLTAFASLIAISPTVRATVVQWVKGIYKGETVYSFEGQAPKTCSQYVLTHIPDGYVLDDIWEHDDGATYFYHADGGQVLRFRYSCGTEDITVYLNTQEYEYCSANVGNMTADIYISQDNKCSTIVWTDSESAMLFVISYAGEIEELIYLAQSVKNK